MIKDDFHSKSFKGNSTLSSNSLDNVEVLITLSRQILSKVRELEARFDVQEALLLEIRKQSFTPAPHQQTDLIRGINGLAEFLSTSVVKAQEIKNSGKIPFYQIDRVVLFNPQKVIEAMEKYYENGKKK